MSHIPPSFHLMYVSYMASFCTFFYNIQLVFTFCLLFKIVTNWYILSSSIFFSHSSLLFILNRPFQFSSICFFVKSDHFHFHVLACKVEKKKVWHSFWHSLCHHLQYIYLKQNLIFIFFFRCLRQIRVPVIVTKATMVLMTTTTTFFTTAKLPHPKTAVGSRWVNSAERRMATPTT